MFVGRSGLDAWIIKTKNSDEAWDAISFLNRELGDNGVLYWTNVQASNFGDVTPPTFHLVAFSQIKQGLCSRLWNWFNNLGR